MQPPVDLRDQVIGPSGVGIIGQDCTGQGHREEFCDGIYDAVVGPGRLGYWTGLHGLLDRKVLECFYYGFCRLSTKG